MNNNTHKVGSYGQAIVVALVLGALTVVELLVAIYLHNPVVILLLIAAFKAVLVIRFYMHINRLWAPEGEH